MLEPLFDDGSDKYKDDGIDIDKGDGSDTYNDDGNGKHKGDGIEKVSWRKWDGFNDSMTLVLSLKSVQDSISSSSRAGRTKKQRISNWELKTLLVRNGAFAPSIRTLLDASVKGEQFVAWMLYTFASGFTGKYSPMQTVMKALLGAPAAWPGGAYDRLANMPPKVLINLLDRAIKSPGERTGSQDWDGHMLDVPEQRLRELKGYLIGED